MLERSCVTDADSTASEAAEQLPSHHANVTWPCASERPWVLPDLAAAFPPETGSRWHYYACLAGHTYR